MFQTLKKFAIGLFSKSNKRNKSLSTDTKSLLETNYILITFDPKDNEPYIKLNLSDLSDHARDQYALTLFNLNTGRYHQSFLDLLLDMSHQDLTINRFIQTLIIRWSNLVKNSPQDLQTSTIDSNQPIVSPMDFNKHAK